MDFFIVLAVFMFAAAAVAALFYYFSRKIALEYTAAEKTELSDGVFKRNQAVNDTWRTVAQIVGGAAFVITFVWTMFQDRENNAFARQQEADRLYVDAATMVKKGDPLDQAAGALILNKVAEGNASYALPVRDYLAALILTHPDPGNQAVPFARAKVADVATVTAIRGLGSRIRLAEDEKRPLDLEGAYLVGARFNGSSGFSNTIFYRAKLYGADFSGADVSKSHFDSAKMSDFEAYGGWDGKAPGGWTKDTAFTPGRWLDWERYRFVVDFRGATLTGATFTGTGLTGALFDKADIANVDFTRANISRASFVGTKNVKKANFSLACWSDHENGRETRNHPVFDDSVGAKFVEHPVTNAPGEVVIGFCP